MKAKRVITVSNAHSVLEGASFNRAGELVFTDSSQGTLLVLSKKKRLKTIFRAKSEFLGGTAIHKNGRIFLTTITKDFKHGSIVSVKEDGSDIRSIVDYSQGFVPNDIVFDRHGGFYFTDFRGTYANPQGGVYYVSPETHRITSVLKNLALANGVALSPDEHTLWVTEYGRNQLYRIDLTSPTEYSPSGVSIRYRFTGHSPDSMRTDSQGNVYVAVMNQGRVLVFSSDGMPVAQILLPGRNSGRNLETASLALDQNEKRVFIVSGDIKSASIFEAKTVAKGTILFSHK